MRDLLITLIVFGSIPFILRRPYIGVLVWSWLGYMNPHRLTWGFAYNMPFSMVIAITTLVAVVFYKGPKRLPQSPVVWLLIAFVAWISVSTSMIPADHRDYGFIEYQRMLKIQVVIFLSMMLFQEKRKIILLVWFIALSIGYYGIKGGIFSILTGFQHRIWGPKGSFIEGNNEVGLAMLMIMPLFYFIISQVQYKYLKLGLVAVAGLIGIAAIATYSRGAMLAGSCMLFFLWVKSHNKLPTGLLAAVLVVVVLFNMPEAWYERMMSIHTYEEDESAMGRINAWKMALAMAGDKVFGGGYGAFNTMNFIKYVNNTDMHDAHSIYFEILGEQGYIGLILFLSLFVAGWGIGRSIIRQGKDIKELQWAVTLAKMLQVSLVAYGSGGAFLGLAYFDLPYHLLSLLVVTKVVVERELAGRAQPQKVGRPLSFQEKLKGLQGQPATDVPAEPPGR